MVSLNFIPKVKPFEQWCDGNFVDTPMEFKKDVRWFKLLCHKNSFVYYLEFNDGKKKILYFYHINFLFHLGFN